MTLIDKIIGYYYKRKYLSRYKAVLKPEFYVDSQTSLNNELISEGYQSQFGQDKWVHETLLPNCYYGIFIDIGAYDGVTHNNTYYLEKNLGWEGISVEPSPRAFQRLSNNRNCTSIQTCIANKNEDVKFLNITGAADKLSGMTDFFNRNHISQIDDVIKNKGGEFKEITCPCEKLNKLIKQYSIKKVDYLGVDVEGAELSVLESIDFNEVEYSIIGVENPYKNSKIYRLLNSKNFEFHSIVGDEFYINKKYLR